MAFKLSIMSKYVGISHSKKRLNFHQQMYIKKTMITVCYSDVKTCYNQTLTVHGSYSTEKSRRVTPTPTGETYFTQNIIRISKKE